MFEFSVNHPQASKNNMNRRPSSATISSHSSCRESGNCSTGRRERGSCRNDPRFDGGGWSSIIVLPVVPPLPDEERTFVPSLLKKTWEKHKNLMEHQYLVQEMT